MPTRRPAEITPDLFSALPTVTTAGPSAVPKGKAGPASQASQQRHFLPTDLAGALKRLDDVEIDALLAAVTTEAERRGRRLPSPAKEKPVADAKPQRRQDVAEDGAGAGRASIDLAIGSSETCSPNRPGSTGASGKIHEPSGFWGQKYFEVTVYG